MNEKKGVKTNKKMESEQYGRKAVRKIKESLEITTKEEEISICEENLGEKSRRKTK